MIEYKKSELKLYMDGLKRTFDVARIVDPIKNVVPFSEGLDKTPVEVACYGYWRDKGVCDNCISVRAIEEDKTITKIEYDENGAFLVISTPILIDNEKYAIEMLLNIKEINTIRDLNKENNEKIQGVITNLKENLLIDELTGVYNRRFINENLPGDIEYGKSRGVDLVAVIMVDIDDFKEINDNYGHLVGDHTLQKVAHIMKSRIRSNLDWVARYGGDEFIILLKNADEIIANNVIKEIQEEINSSNIISSNTKSRITLSFGIHVIEPGTMNYEKVIEVVDKNLNKAKCLGKNRGITS